MRARRLQLQVVATMVMALSFACSSGEGERDAAVDPGDPTPALARELPSPAGPGAGMPNLSVTEDGRVLMSWLEPVDATDEAAASTRRGRFALRLATLSGETWSAPRTVAEGDDFFVNWADFPMIIESRGVLTAHWMRMNGGRGTSYDIQIARSEDGGETWADPVVPHTDGTQTEHGFVSLVPEIDGGFTAIWLDGRKFAAQEPGASAEMTLRGARFDTDGTEGPELLLDPRICDCCQTSATYVGDTLVVVYRDRSDTEIRDIWSVRRNADGWHDPVRVAHDDWQIPGCPVNGPAVAAEGDGAAVAWFSLRDGNPEVKVAFTRDAGASFSEPVLLDRAGAADIDSSSAREVAGLADASSAAAPIPLGRVDITWIDDSRVAVSWIVGRGGKADVVLQAVDLDGNLGRRHVVATTGSGRSSGFPRMVRQGERLLIAWTETGGDSSIVQTATIALPLQ